MPRGKMLDTFEAAEKAGPYDEYPVLTGEVDPQLHLSRNDRPQPFYLTCEKDCVLVQMSGNAFVDMRDSSVLRFKLVPGDYAYIPGGTPHRITPTQDSAQYRYKARDAGLEAISFYCSACDGLLYRETWDTSGEVPQAAYLRVTERFNGEPELRTCAGCAHESPPIDLRGFRWRQIAEELSQEEESAW
jgi:3-hydroxyanthranilate 3,4-dioxygenase